LAKNHANSYTMTHLQQALEARRALQREPEDYVATTSAQASALSLHQASGEACVFLWSTLVSAWYDPSEGGEKIVLTFLRHVVSVEGQNLDRIMAEIGEIRLHAIRERHDGGDHTGHSETGKTLVTKITVERVDELPITIENPTGPET
jgi:hypothetical protein